MKPYLMETIESVNVPDNMLGEVKSRSTLYRSGVFLRSGFVNPGYKGKLFFMLLNISPKPFKVQLGAR